MHLSQKHYIKIYFNRFFSVNEGISLNAMQVLLLHLFALVHSHSHLITLTHTRTHNTHTHLLHTRPSTHTHIHQTRTLTHNLTHTYTKQALFRTILHTQHACTHTTHRFLLHNASLITANIYSIYSMISHTNR